MIKILFVCHGNICRSPMAEFVLKDMVAQEGLSQEFFIASAATSTEELGNPVHPGTKKKLKEHGIDPRGKYAIQVTKHDYQTYDYILGMDQQNIKNLHRMLGKDNAGKIKRLLDFTSHPRDIADPWYTGNFDKTYDDIYEGCTALLETLLSK